MANHYRILLTAFSQEHAALHSFLGALITDGWDAHVPVENHNPDPDIITSEVHTWSGYLFPDMRIMTRSSRGITKSFSTEDAQDLPGFKSQGCADQYTAMLTGQSYPAWVGPRETDALAIVMGESRVAPPSRWIKTVIDKYYDDGLRFFMVCYDVGDIPYVELPDRSVFYSVSSGESNLKMEDSEHAVAIELSGTRQSGTAEESAFSNADAHADGIDYFSNLAE